MKRKALRPVMFPAGDAAFSTFCLGVRVWENGRIEMTGLIRKPYSDRPKVGGGIAVPYRALNVNLSVKAQGPRFRALKAGVGRSLRAPVAGQKRATVERKTYKPRCVRRTQPLTRAKETPKL